MAEKRDYYQVLGVSKSASADELKSAYRKLAMKWHPDRWVSGTEAEKKTAEANFKEASEAYAVLSDPQKRARYDQFGFAGENGGAGGGFGGFGGFDFGGFGSGGGFGINLDDILNDFFGGGGSRSSSRGTRRGEDIQVTVTLTLEEIARGTEKELTLQRKRPCAECGGRGTKNASDVKTCSYCNGQGRVYRQQGGLFGMRIATECPTCHGTGKTVSNPCRKCGGSGIETRRETVKVRIPAGIEAGQPLQISGEGNYGGPGSVNGDLYVIVQEAPGSEIIRQGQDLFTSATISVMDAMLGTEIEVPGVGAHYKIKIEPGTQSGTTIRLRGKGLPSPRGGFGATAGDLYVKILVWIPRNLSRSEKEMFQALRANASFMPDPNREDRETFEKIKKVY